MSTGRPLIIVLLALPLLLPYLRRGHHLSTGHLLAIGVFAMYLVGVASYTVFPLRFEPEDLALPRQPGMSPSIELVPFLLASGDVMTRDQVIGNLLLGVPFGFGLPFVWRTSASGALFAGLLFSCSIEAIQALLNAFGVAFPPRTADINDVLLNTLGVAFGILAFLFARVAYRALFAQPSRGRAVKSACGPISIARWWLAPIDDRPAGAGDTWPPS